MPVPVILDCDPGHDDALAILLAAADPRLNLLLISTVAGNQTLEKTSLNARRVCSVAGITGIPVAAGCDKPLAGRPLVSADIHGESGLDGPGFEEPTVPLEDAHSVGLMSEVLGASPERITLVATGPLTNVAVLLRDHPNVKDKLGEIVLMGGSTERGNFSPYAEFNIAADPEAADIVFGSGLSLTMCGLNVTHQALVTDSVLDRWKALDTNVARLCINLMTFFSRTYRDVFNFDHPPLHDPVAVARVIDPTLVGCVKTAVAIELVGEHTRGATVVDLHARTGLRTNANVAVSLDVERFWDLMIGAVSTLGSRVT